MRNKDGTKRRKKETKWERKRERSSEDGGRKKEAKWERKRERTSGDGGRKGVNRQTGRRK